MGDEIVPLPGSATLLERKTERPEADENQPHENRLSGGRPGYKKDSPTEEFGSEHGLAEDRRRIDLDRNYRLPSLTLKTRQVSGAEPWSDWSSRKNAS